MEGNGPALSAAVVDPIQPEDSTVHGNVEEPVEEAEDVFEEGISGIAQNASRRASISEIILHLSDTILPFFPKVPGLD
ncbi:hypothetical protein DdX_08348 [Ditylenchus destructor]|uniref:Uncharacterized protein n=1 Tax=Ditylenchus destructor TaxID=166010 RepID=A0AAD4N6D1_9BILA|nr:hypothetical protein DdX_08348 [Ditylenchus destructor]